MKQTFLITGAGSAVGRALVEHLSSRPDVRLLLTTRRQAVFSNPSSAAVHMPNIDFLDPADLETFSKWVQAETEGPFTVINCLGYFPGFVPIAELPIAEARRVYESNVLALYAVATVCIPVMTRNGGGHFLAFSSHAVSQAYPLMGAFASAKAAVELLIKSIANEYARDGVVATALAPATIDTPVERELTPMGDFEHWLRPEQICNLIDRLVDGSFSIVNGNTIQLYNYSDSYFGQSYFDRIGRKPRS
jgi:3-oxoacyl-[acyl-carrier protein] reductase